MTPERPHLPRLAPIEAYGKGGFRFADMSHRGSLLCLPSGIWEWEVRRAEEIDAAALAPVLSEAAAIDFLVIGSGRDPWAVPADLRASLRAAGISVEVMPTGSAVSTFNILLGERRRVAAALVAAE